MSCVHFHSCPCVIGHKCAVCVLDFLRLTSPAFFVQRLTAPCKLHVCHHVLCVYVCVSYVCLVYATRLCGGNQMCMWHKLNTLCVTCSNGWRDELDGGDFVLYFLECKLALNKCQPRLHWRDAYEL